jgi:hypothetical protein
MPVICPTCQIIFDDDEKQIAFGIEKARCRFSRRGLLKILSTMMICQ